MKKKNIVIPLLFALLCGGELRAAMPKVECDGSMSIVVDGQSIDIAPIERLSVEGEKHIMEVVGVPNLVKGGRLKAPTGNGRINMIGSLDPATLVVRAEDGTQLVRGSDYALAENFATIALCEGGDVKRGAKVYADYTYSLQRIDAISRGRDGRYILTRGTPAIRTPQIPATPVGATPLMNVYVEFNCKAITADNIFYITEPEMESNPLNVASKGLNAIKKRMAKGGVVKIVCWGDSITEGADVNRQKSWFVRFSSLIRTLYPDAQIEVVNYGIGSSTSSNWFYNDAQFGRLNANRKRKLSFEMLLDEKPDIIVSEFFNDMMIAKGKHEELYNGIYDSFKREGIEWVVLSPSISIPSDNNIAAMKRGQTPHYISFLRDFVQRKKLSFADAFASWEHLEEEGIPYFSLFNNGFNHPCERGHQIFVDELQTIFER